ncbi:hypothetical protein [Sediminispirochaeta bajacaliforniensis]|uniref:hypothetical protein n=1 Tax=Sediminispirochaeta bajacaliforniensis TaxID=148 RepID=UPI00036968F8
MDKTKELNSQNIQETILVPFSILYKNEKRLKNADIVAAITGNKDVNIKIIEEIQLTDKEDVRKVKIDEESLFDTIYTETYADVVTYCKTHIDGWKQNKCFHKHMREIKKIDELHKARFLDPNNERSSKKDFYSKSVYRKLRELYDN